MPKSKRKLPASVAKKTEKFLNLVKKIQEEEVKQEG
jgi:hypothetical protein